MSKLPWPPRFLPPEGRFIAVDEEGRHYQFCTDCGRYRLSSKFSSQGWRRRHPLCKACERSRRRQAVYGTPPDIINLILKTQNGVCPICGTTPKEFVVDHDHETGEVRGLLCSSCNKALGFLHDSADNARRAADYLDRVACFYASE